jgi:Transcriptional regulator, AbiEi antitoxin
MRSRLDELLPLAEQNDGLVTASQARAIGIADSILARLTLRGKRERVARGVYRIPYFPADRLSAIPGIGLVGARESWPRACRALSRNRIGRVWDLRCESVASPYYGPQKCETPAPEAEVDRNPSGRPAPDRCDRARRPAGHNRGEKRVGNCA